MVSPSTRSSASGPNMGKLRVLLEMVKWEHTVFALPFAYAGMLAAPTPFSVLNLIWIFAGHSRVKPSSGHFFVASTIIFDP